jgi:hypothetical protein
MKVILIFLAVLCLLSAFAAADGLTVIVPSAWTVTQVSSSTVQLRPNNIAGWPNDAYIVITNGGTGSVTLDFTAQGYVLSASYTNGKPKLAIIIPDMPSGIGWSVHLPSNINTVTVCAHKDYVEQPTACPEASKAVIPKAEMPKTVSVVDMYGEDATVDSYFDVNLEINIEIYGVTHIPLDSGGVEGENGGDGVPEFNAFSTAVALIGLIVLLVVLYEKRR